MQVSHYTVNVLVRGRPVVEYPHQGRIYIEGRKGSEFDLQFRNNSSKNVMVVPSVDGLSVMDGKPAGDQSNGYVVRGYETLNIPGWRLNNQEVAKFVFNDRRGSYAEQTGGGENVGVIGFLVFEELVHHIAPRPYYPLSGSLNTSGYPYYPYGEVTCDSSLRGTSWSSSGMGIAPQNAALGVGSVGSSTPRSAKIAAKRLHHAPNEQFSLGTGFGRADMHAVREVHFQKRSDQPDARMVLFYDHRKNLERMGIRIEKKRTSPNYGVPNAFPAMQSGCTPPPGWRG